MYSVNYDASVSPIGVCVYTVQYTPEHFFTAKTIIFLPNILLKLVQRPSLLCNSSVVIVECCGRARVFFPSFLSRMRLPQIYTYTASALILSIRKKLACHEKLQQVTITGGLMMRALQLFSASCFLTNSVMQDQKPCSQNTALFILHENKSSLRNGLTDKRILSIHEVMNDLLIFRVQLLHYHF